MMWYGLYLNDDLIAVIKWDKYGMPSPRDFNSPTLSVVNGVGLEVYPVAITPVGKSLD